MTDKLLHATVSVRGIVGLGDGKVLVVERSSDGEWELPGGRLGPAEDVVAGLKRELREETAIEIAVGDAVHANAWRNDDDDGRFAVYYRCRAAERDVQLSAEHDAFRWLSPAEATALLAEPQATAVRLARPDEDASVASQRRPSGATSD